MQIRSFRGSGEPVWVSALPSAGVRLGPDPRRALGPAAAPAASTGRTRDRTRPMLQLRQKVLARAPSTRDPKRTSRSCADSHTMTNATDVEAVLINRHGVDGRLLRQMGGRTLAAYARINPCSPTSIYEYTPSIVRNRFRSHSRTRFSKAMVTSVYSLTISTRRFLLRPASSSFDATGAMRPAPTAFSRSGTMP